MKMKKIWGSLDPFVERGGVLGRGVANRSFLHELFTQNLFDEYHFFLRHSDEGEALRRFARENHPELLAGKKIRIMGRPDLLQALARTHYHCFHLSDCINYPAHLARLRNAVAPLIFPITSVTHSLSYTRYGKEFLAHLWQGNTPRDVVVATSETAREAVNAYHAEMARAYGMATDSYSPPKVEVLPLGVNLGDFIPPSPEEKAAFRSEWSVPKDSVALLVFARLSHTSKLDALPLLRALRRAAAKPLSLNSFTLVLAGAHDEREDGDYVKKLLDLARNLGIKTLAVCNPDNAMRRILFSLADIFVSPVDNYQETFGLSILEAGAMGLPVVASDFDGYRSLVEHERTGLLVPTTGPRQSDLLDILGNLLMDNQHHLLAAQSLAVDVPALAGAVRNLALSPDLRSGMGVRGRERVLREFSWRSVVERYVRLWDELWEKPVSEQERERLRTVAHPQHPPLSRVFRGYPTGTLDREAQLRWSAVGEAYYRGVEGLVVYGGLQGFLEPERVKRLVFAARKPQAVGYLTQRLMDEDAVTSEMAEWCLLWALKHDLLERVE